MKQLTATIIILILTLPCFAQKYWEDSAYQQRAIKAAAERKLAREKQNAYWDSINNKRNSEYKAGIIKKYGVKTGTKIADGKIEIDYTKEMCEYAWGSPDNTRIDGKKESWYYRKNKTALTFSSGKLVMITEL